MRHYALGPRIAGLGVWRRAAFVTVSDYDRWRALFRMAKCTSGSWSSEDRVGTVRFASPHAAREALRGLLPADGVC